MAISRSAVRLPRRKKLLDSPLGLLGHVHLALFEPLQQLLRREVDQLDLAVTSSSTRIRYRLVHGDAGDLGHDIAQTLQMLHMLSVV